MAAISLKMAITSYSHRRLIFVSILVFWGPPIDRTAKLGYHQKIQNGRQDGCRSEYYSDSIHSYPREIIFVYIPWFSRLLNTLEQLILRLDGYIIDKFKSRISSTTPNFIFYKQLFSNTSFQALAV